MPGTTDEMINFVQFQDILLLNSRAWLRMLARTAAVRLPQLQADVCAASQALRAQEMLEFHRLSSERHRRTHVLLNLQAPTSSLRPPGHVDLAAKDRLSSRGRVDLMPRRWVSHHKRRAGLGMGALAAVGSGSIWLWHARVYRTSNENRKKGREDLTVVVYSGSDRFRAVHLPLHGTLRKLLRFSQTQAVLHVREREELALQRLQLCQRYLALKAQAIEFSVSFRTVGRAL